VSGYNAYQERIILTEKVPLFDPGLVIVAYCLNDDSYTDGLGALEREMSPSALGPRLHSQLLALILHRLERGVLTRYPDRKKVEQLFISLNEGSKKHNYQALVAVFPYKYETVEHYDELDKHHRVRSLLDKHHIQWVDFLDVWKEKSPEKRTELYMEEDKVHLSQLGMLEVGEKLFDYVLTTKFSKNRSMP
jgi:lysophospholipase L1-like esterase